MFLSQLHSLGVSLQVALHVNQNQPSCKGQELNPQNREKADNKLRLWEGQREEVLPGAGEFDY